MPYLTAGSSHDCFRMDRRSHVLRNVNFFGQDFFYLNQNDFVFILKMSLLKIMRKSSHIPKSARGSVTCCGHAFKTWSCLLWLNLHDHEGFYRITRTASSLAKRFKFHIQFLRSSILTFAVNLSLLDSYKFLLVLNIARIFLAYNLMKIYGSWLRFYKRRKSIKSFCSLTSIWKKNNYLGMC